MSVEDIKSLVKTDILNIYRYGSQNYGTAHAGSDTDYMVIIKDQEVKVQEIESKEFKLNIQIYTQNMFQKKLDDHEIEFIEAINFPILETVKMTFNFDANKLRHSVSKKSSNSYVKAKKKLTVEKDRDYYSAKKSLYHVFRMLDYGVQLCKNNGKILNWESQKDLYHDIMKLPEDPEKWSEWEKTYKKKYNALSSEFKKVAPKTN
jgi:hypothetical protein